MERDLKYEAMGKIMLKDLAEELNDPDNIPRAARTLKSILYAFTNMLKFEDSIRFLNLIPIYAKGIEYIEWTVGNNNVEEVETLDNLITELRKINKDHFAEDFPTHDEARWAIQSVFRILNWHTNQETMQELVRLLPDDIRVYLEDVAIV